ncbi:uncharacterized protein A4U43_C04F11730 [Asparagus officinalis]|uniref:Uncharacterized protein n=1 Tax=Asparagus officinalis TaxID=4686 RepID=A0A5P1F047_ASPOF|nr:uncharacterized protein A4U43_C04F11730 [Asparagus officinalis]
MTFSGDLWHLSPRARAPAQYRVSLRRRTSSNPSKNRLDLLLYDVLERRHASEYDRAWRSSCRRSVEAPARGGGGVRSAADAGRSRRESSRISTAPEAGGCGVWMGVIGEETERAGEGWIEPRVDALGVERAWRQDGRRRSSSEGGTGRGRRRSREMTWVSL